LYIKNKFFVEKCWDKYTHSAHIANHNKMKIQYPLPVVSLDSLRAIVVKKEPTMKFDIVSVNTGE